MSKPHAVHNGHTHVSSSLFQKSHPLPLPLPSIVGQVSLQEPISPEISLSLPNLLSQACLSNLSQHIFIEHIRVFPGSQFDCAQNLGSSVFLKAHHVLGFILTPCLVISFCLLLWTFSPSLARSLRSLNLLGWRNDQSPLSVSDV